MQFVALMKQARIPDHLVMQQVYQYCTPSATEIVQRLVQNRSWQTAINNIAEAIDGSDMTDARDQLKIDVRDKAKDKSAKKIVKLLNETADVFEFINSGVLLNKPKFMKQIMKDGKRRKEFGSLVEIAKDTAEERGQDYDEDPWMYLVLAARKRSDDTPDKNRKKRGKGKRKGKRGKGKRRGKKAYQYGGDDTDSSESDSDSERGQGRQSQADNSSSSDSDIGHQRKKNQRQRKRKKKGESSDSGDDSEYDRKQQRKRKGQKGAKAKGDTSVTKQLDNKSSENLREEKYVRAKTGARGVSFVAPGVHLSEDPKVLAARMRLDILKSLSEQQDIENETEKLQKKLMAANDKARNERVSANLAAVTVKPEAKSDEPKPPSEDMVKIEQLDQVLQSFVAAAAAQGNGALQCWKCNQSGHLANTCPNPDTRVCYTCGKSGHISRACPSNNNTNFNRNRQNNYGNNGANSHARRGTNNSGYGNNGNNNRNRNPYRPNNTQYGSNGNNNNNNGYGGYGNNGNNNNNNGSGGYGNNGNNNSNSGNGGYANNNNGNGRGNGNPPTPCMRCRNRGIHAIHWTSDCPYGCEICGQTGHTVKKCPKNAKP
jgi:hypothetical protein